MPETEELPVQPTIVEPDKGLARTEVRAEVLKLERFDSFDQIEKICYKIFATGFVPTTIASPMALAAILMYGNELGVKPYTSMMQIHNIQGRCSPSVHLMMSQLRKHGIRWRLVKDCALVLNDKGQVIDKVVEIEFMENDPNFGVIRNNISYSWAEEGIYSARKSALDSNSTLKDNWIKYFRTMMVTRCLTKGARFVCPEGIMGYDPTEIADFSENANISLELDGNGNPTSINGEAIQEF